GVTDTRPRPEADTLLLASVNNRDQEHQRPQQRRAVILARLRVRAEGAGVVVADHHDQSRTKDRGEGLPACAQPDAWRGIAVTDRSQSSKDMSDMGVVESGASVQWSFQVGVRFVGNSHESCLRCRTRGLTVRVGLAGLWLAVFGSFSAMPRAAARARISRQILAGSTLARHHRTTRW